MGYTKYACIMCKLYYEKDLHKYETRRALSIDARG